MAIKASMGAYMMENAVATMISVPFYFCHYAVLSDLARGRRCVLLVLFWKKKVHHGQKEYRIFWGLELPKL